MKTCQLFALLGSCLGQTKLNQIDTQLAKCQGINLLELTIEDTLAHFRSGNLLPSQLTACYLKRIQKMNPFLNAIIETNPDAMAIALTLDKALAKRDLPLYGIPILVKDNIGTLDQMETTAGCVALLGARPKKDADVVKRLRRLGAVVLGKTNMSELSG
ncbi:hypothetical protein DSO57_1015929 [Entomophthora muscae]|uniref:Uncharacterized protein n=2 Tax=Entomophthora muscae TaxID=34485 RepID=A0ACC2RPR5_9FUNG|nr:hypothetical protein DSO57_1038051 [Entomophthora muscae]KAJ9077527.1 hypothetical protein DSO57_1015929 [Entomophthora muscae]